MLKKQFYPGPFSIITEENGQVTSTITYAYDADGNRIQTNADGQVTQYVVDSNDSLSQVVAELNQDNQVKVAYLYGDDLVSQYRGNEINYYHYDGLGSTRVLTDNSGEVTDSYTYEAFGELVEQSGETENNYLYTGEQLDPNTGNYYLRARYYNPANGRFLSMDSFDGIPQDPITLHKYLYGSADPVNMIDPSGYFSLGSLSAGNAVSGILTNMHRLYKVLDIINFVTDPAGAVTEKLTNKALGALVLLRRLGNQGHKLLRLFSKKARQGFCPFQERKNSFTAGTLVHTQRGINTIEDIKIGDRVWSFNEETGEQQLNEVVHLIQGEQEYDLVILTLDNGETIEATVEHPFYVVDQGWTEAKTLVVEQVLTLQQGHVSIAQVKNQRQKIAVYNLAVANAHTFYVSESGILVHNCTQEEINFILSAKIHGGRQGKHVPGHNNYEPGRSTLTHPDPQSLLNRYSGTGQAKGGKWGKPGYVEHINFHEVIGKYMAKESTIGIPTTKATVKYGKKGAHIVPARP